MNAVMKAPRLVRYAAGVLALASSTAWANATDPARWQLNLTPGVTATSQNAYHAHMIMLWICVVIGIIVFGAMGYKLIDLLPTTFPYRLTLIRTKIPRNRNCKGAE